MQIAATLALLATAVTAFAQPAPPAKKNFQEFEVASIRENNSSDTATRMNFPLGAGDAYKPNGGHFSVANMPLSGYIAFAWKLTPSQGAALSPQLPEWVKVTHYDIEARVEGEPAKDDMRTMMRALLADRFHLRLHSETREVAVFDMILAKAGKTGPSLKPHPADDSGCLLSHAPEGFFSPCGIFGAMPGLPARMAGRNIPLQMFADNISNLAGHPRRRQDHPGRQLRLHSHLPARQHPRPQARRSRPHLPRSPCRAGRLQTHPRQRHRSLLPL